MLCIGIAVYAFLPAFQGNANPAKWPQQPGYAAAVLVQQTPAAGRGTGAIAQLLERKLLSGILLRRFQ